MTSLQTRLGAENGGAFGPACFLVELCHCRVLLECPIDLSALLWFLPTILPTTVHSKASAQAFPSISSRSTLAGVTNGSKTNNQSCDFDDCLRIAAKRSRLEADRTKAANVHQLDTDWGHLFREIDGRFFLDAAPCYKIPDFNLVDISSVNAVIISNPIAMLGLPLLVRNPDFTAKIYATEASAKLGQLMMEELVALHMEYIHIYGKSTDSSIPTWQLPIYCASLSSEGRMPCIGSNGLGEKWHCLYSTVDIKACMARVQRLHYGEEAKIDGCINVKPSSSGFGIGASNWVLKGAHRSMSYISSSVNTTNHAMPLDISSLEGSQVLLFSHGDAMETSQGESCDVEKEVIVAENVSTEVKDVTTTNETHQISEGMVTSKQSSQRTSPSPSSSVSPAPLGSMGSNVGGIHKLSPSASLPVTPEKAMKYSVEENEDPRATNSMVLDEQMQLICKASVDALGGGGCVLIPINLYGMFLELLEKMAAHLRFSGLEAVPIYFISPVGEELLAFSNTVPEWLSPARQEKLYAGEPLFGFVEALQEKRLNVLPALHVLPVLQSKDLMSWQEPCVVFATHWSLRAGSAVHLLQRWRNNPLCLLVLTEPNVDQDLLLAPFKPFSIQILSLPVFTNLRSMDIVSIIQKSMPQLTVVPENLKILGSIQGLKETNLGLLWYHKVWKTLKIPCFQDKINREAEVSADLALQIQLKQVKSGKVAAACLNAELHMKDGHWLLDTASPQTYHRDTHLSSLPKYQIRWGTVDVPALVKALGKQGMSDIFVSERIEEESGSNEESDGKVIVIEIKSPSRGNIELSSSRINIHANELSFRRHILEIVNSALSIL